MDTIVALDLDLEFITLWLTLNIKYVYTCKLF